MAKTSANPRKSSPKVIRTPAIPINYTKPPKQGTRLGNPTRPHVLVKIKPWTTKEGKPSAVLTWSSSCEICNIPFITTTGLRTVALTKRCDDHRTKRPALSKTLKAKAKAIREGQQPLSMPPVQNHFEMEQCCHENDEPCSDGPCNCECECECDFDTEDDVEVEEYEGDGMVYCSAYCRTHRKFHLGKFPGFVKRGMYQEHWSSECY